MLIKLAADFEQNAKRRFWRLIGLFVLAAIVLVGAGSAVYLSESSRIEAAVRTQAHGRVSLGIEATERAVDRAVRDLQYIGRTNVLQSAVEASGHHAITLLTADWVAFSRAKGIYDQIRWLDETGMERVRVDYRPGDPIVVPAYQLQDKSKRYFFTDSIKLGMGEVFISPLDLNIEGNAVEVPWKPTIRLAMPVFDRRGDKRGVVILNYLARDLLDRLRKIGAPSMRLVNADGYWLLGANPEQEFGFMFKRTDFTMGSQSPAAWAAVSTGKQGQFETSAGLWTYTTVSPLVQGARTSSGSHEAFSPSRTRLDNEAYVWKIVDFVPRELYVGPAHAIGQRIAAITALVLALIGLALIRIGHSMAAESRAVVQLAEGNAALEERIALRTYELEAEVQVRRAAEVEARTALDQYQTILDATSDGFWLIDPQGKVLDVNVGYCENLGYQREEVVGHSFNEFDAALDGARNTSNIARAQRIGHVNFETVHRAKDGSIRHLDVSMSRVGRGNTIVAFLRDIGERKKIEARLNQLARITEVTDNGVMVTTPDGVITYVNGAFTTITGYTASEALGQTPALLRSGRHDESFYNELWRQINTYGHWQGHIWNRRRDGSLYAEWLTISDVRDAHGSITHFVSLFSDITRLLHGIEDIEHMAHHDGLTGLPNRLLISARLTHAIERAARENTWVALMFIDLDHFKDVNDRAGHSAGDEVLQSVATRLLTVCRAGDTLGRLGGDEFIVILEDVTDENDVERVGSEILNTFPICVEAPGGKIEVTASIGLAYFPKDGTDMATLLKTSDSAMYRAKREGRNRLSRS